MALFKLDIEKRWLGEFWTNRYILQGESITELIPSAEEIVAAEKAIHLSVVTFTKYRISDSDPSTSTFVIVPINDVGDRNAGSAGLPAFNCVRVDFPAGFGRPSRKYLRLPLQSAEVSNNDIAIGLISLVNTQYGAVLGDLVTFVDVDGETLGTGVAQQQVAMRQLRRGSKRRQTSVI
jgi:hypothetical protein